MATDKLIKPVISGADPGNISARAQNTAFLLTNPRRGEGGLAPVYVNCQTVCVNFDILTDSEEWPNFYGKTDIYLFPVTPPPFKCRSCHSAS